ncbi:tRNA pseudouridine(55) synthase TruB [Microbacterium sp. LRZ72]|uniref:tRNA pseudouridine(55) synthase TruB n=1 Tax=Microbacterium sp. LRZ72 TaxID=2942481 RepID=UPI0029A41E44|nr:tRNA pseudouridine(55) synthase TruB [Microbacterium sp. LRZ72]MDX2377395.1 tRNA pseudouridine(55) synthase TruB [Microbacterium sp. LRZ72]
MGGHPGMVLVDKPAGVTSHDVVARARRALGTRKIGHAGTLDPMATGLLVLGVESATRLLTYLVGLDKTYEATIRLGSATTTDDAEGETLDVASLDTIERVTDPDIAAGVAALTGAISQVPSSVSAIKVDGRRAYDLARKGEDVTLAARAVTVARFDLRAVRRAAGTIDLDVVIDCSSGTYIRALARDLGADLGVGGHLTALRRTRVGPFAVDDAVVPDAIAVEALADPAEVAATVLGRFEVSDDEARALWQGKRLTGAAPRLVGERQAAITTGGTLVGVVERRGDDIKSAMNLPAPAAAGGTG